MYILYMNDSATLRLDQSCAACVQRRKLYAGADCGRFDSVKPKDGTSGVIR